MHSLIALLISAFVRDARSSSCTRPHTFLDGNFLCRFARSGLFSCEHLPASQRGGQLCQICPQVVLQCRRQGLHTLLVRRLRREPEPLRHAREVCEGLRETRCVTYGVDTAKVVHDGNHQGVQKNPTINHTESFIINIIGEVYGLSILAVI